MEFKINNQGEDIKVILLEREVEKATATCYYKNTPIVKEKNIGCIGEFKAENKEYGVLILKKCEKILREKNVDLIVAPMNGNTWKKYRTLKYSNGDSTFLLEDVSPESHNEILLNAGFKELYTYTSTKGYIKDAYTSVVLEMLEEKLEKEKISIRPFNTEKYREDLEKIYNVSIASFSRNPFYTPIEKEDFIRQYEQYINMVDKDLVLIAEKDGKEVGFIFCIPNFNELKEGKELKTLIVKTVAVLPEYEHYAIGNVLLNRIAKIAKLKNLSEWIFAFMYSNNTSQKMAQRNKTEIIREYAIYGKRI